MSDEFNEEKDKLSQRSGQRRRGSLEGKVGRKPVDVNNLKNRGSKKKNGFIPILIGVVVVVSLLILAIDKFMPNSSVKSLREYDITLDAESNYIVMGEELLKDYKSPVFENGEIYLPVEFVKDKIDEYIFWDEKANRLTITTENKVIQMRTEELEYFVNEKSFMLDIAVNNYNGMAFLPSKILKELYNVDITYNADTKLCVVDLAEEAIPMKSVNVKSGVVRYEPNYKSVIAQKLKKADNVYVFGQEEKYTKVRTTNGTLGYIETKSISEEESQRPVSEQAVKEEVLPARKVEGKVNLMWEQMENVEANKINSGQEKIKGVNVLSPTWFSFDKEKLDGSIKSIADKNYVDLAHEKGYLVWGLITDNFDLEVSHAVLSNTDTREYVVKQLLSFVSMYGLDGINIDFEMVGIEDADYFIQFLRELYPRMKEAGATLSVDMYVPKAYNLYYNRTEVAKTSDYVVIMGYDEHHATSKVSGPVASLPFVKEGIEETLKEVPSEKTILGLPLYVRVWREVVENGEIKVTSKSYGMKKSRKTFEENGAELVWDEAIGSYYGQYSVMEDGVEAIYRVWLEDEKSIEEKMKIYQGYNLAGVASWKRGLENDAVMSVIENYNK